jgi:KipI family sensor histidine kinase inhibitor
MTRIEPLGDCAVLIRFGERIDVQLNARALAAAEAVRRAALPGVTAIAPAYASVTVRYDPRAWHENKDDAPYERFAARIRELVDAATQSAAAVHVSAPVEIPVCYGGEFGPDLAHVAEHAGIAASEVIARHSGAGYHVAMLGFAPGFPYLLGLDASLHTPRRASPRTRVAAGSVAIGGAQTGVYPRELPGGWHLIGRTPLTLFDAARDPPALLAPGVRVRFRAIDAAQFATLVR